MVIDGLKAYVQLASGLTDVTRERALAAARTLVAQGEAGVGAVLPDAMRAQVASVTDDLIATSKANRDLLVGLVRAEVERSVSRLGLVSAAELNAATRRAEALDDRVHELERALRSAAAPPPPRSRRAKKSTAKKSRRRSRRPRSRRPRSRRPRSRRPRSRRARRRQRRSRPRGRVDDQRRLARRRGADRRGARPTRRRSTTSWSSRSRSRRLSRHRATRGLTRRCDEPRSSPARRRRSMSRSTRTCTAACRRFSPTRPASPQPQRRTARANPPRRETPSGEPASPPGHRAGTPRAGPLA